MLKLRIRLLKSSIKNKMMFSFLSIVIFNMIIVSIVGYNISAHYLREKSVNLIKQAQKQQIYEISHNINSYESMISSMIANQYFLLFMSAYFPSYRSEYFIFVERVEPLINSLLLSHEDGIYIQIIRYRQFASQYLMINHEDIISPLFLSHDFIGAGIRFFNIINLYRAERLDWFNEAHNNVDGRWWEQIGSDSTYGNISLLYELEINQAKAGLIRISLCLSVLLREMSSQGYEEYQFFVFGSDNHLLTGDQNKREFYTLHQAGFLQVLSSGENSIMSGDNMFVSSTMLNGWTIITVISAATLFENTRVLFTSIIIVGLSTVLVSSMIIIALANSFTARITGIVKALHSFKDGDFSVRLTNYNTSDDEISYMANSFNDMSTEINELITNNYLINAQKKDEELKALQAQINPHLLFNSLSAVIRLAERNDVPSVKKMILSLSSFYRLTLNSGQKFYKISDEIEHVKNYIDIMRIRMPNSFEVHYNVENNVLNYYTLKVILQPFIENIFKHAVTETDIIVKIVIEVYSDGEDIVFFVCDDGIGIKENIGNTSNGHSGYGIKNANERIKLYYGDKYGVSIWSAHNEGVQVTIRISKNREGN